VTWRTSSDDGGELRPASRSRPAAGPRPAAGSATGPRPAAGGAAGPRPAAGPEAAAGPRPAARTAAATAAGPEAAAGSAAAAGPGARAAAAGPAAGDFPDWRFAPNIGGHPDVYEIENQALDRAGHLLQALRQLAPWAGKTIVDLGCGTGFWLSRYAADAAQVIGLEPDPLVRARALRAAGQLPRAPRIQVLAGSAEHTGLADDSVDVVHARFAYFFPPGTDAGLTEVLRVLRPGGRLIAVDNDYRWGEFAELLAAASRRPTTEVATTVDGWWRARGATRHEVRSEWRFPSRADLAAVLRIEFPARVADAWLARHPAATGLTYGYSLFEVIA
jgi:SAM-dependent methyltransferase